MKPFENMSLLDLDGEKWASFPNWDGLYEVSNLGRVKMLHRSIIRSNGWVQTFREKIKKLTPNHKNKYRMATLTDRQSKRHETFCVHRVVALLFVPNPLNKKEVNHLKTKDDITFRDLEWSTHSENQKDAYSRGLVKALSGSNHVFARKVGSYLNGKLVKEYETMRDAEKEGFNHDAISQAIENNWKCGGYNWKYLSERKWVRRKNLKPKRSIGAFKGEELVRIFKDIDEVKRDGHDRSNIYKAVKDQNITSGGFVWKYLDNKQTA